MDVKRGIWGVNLSTGHVQGHGMLAYMGAHARYPVVTWKLQLHDMDGGQTGETNHNEYTCELT